MGDIMQQVFMHELEYNNKMNMYIEKHVWIKQVNAFKFSNRTFLQLYNYIYYRN